MADAHHEASLEDQIEQWRTALRRQATGPAVDVSQLEPPLRAEIAGLTRAGLTADEAFLIAVKRIGRVDAGSRVFARERSARVWQQLGVDPADSGERRAAARREAWVAFGFAVLAGVAIKVPSLFGIDSGDDANEGFYFRNAGKAKGVRLWGLGFPNEA